MRYLGGKSRIAKQLATRIRELEPNATAYWDPFCGGLSMSVALSAYAPVLVSDACAPLIALYQAVRNGWVPPSEVSREVWQAARSLPDSDPLKAFCGFGCSFSGKWFGGYAADVKTRVSHEVSGDRPLTEAPARAAARGLMRDVVRPSAVQHLDWLSVEPRPLGGVVLYLDPPYANTTGYAGVAPFDHVRFVERVWQWSAYASVFVSEYAFPLGACVWQAQSRARGLAATDRQRLERLYHLPRRRSA